MRLVRQAGRTGRPEPCRLKGAGAEQKLPEALPAEGQSEAEARLRGAILDSIKDWAGHVGNSLYLLEAIGAVLAKLPLAAQPSLATLDCMLPAAQAISSFPPEVRLPPPLATFFFSPFFSFFYFYFC